MSGMAFRIATLKKLWKKEGLMLIMLRSIVGLSVIQTGKEEGIISKIT
jgi:hypothetical protein